MITVEPLKHYYPAFVKDYVSPYDKGTKGYTVLCDMVFLLPELYLADYVDPDSRFTVKTIGHFTEITVYKETWYDGATMAIDYDTRMMFALLHDIACWITSATEDHSYRDALNNLAYEIVTAQNGWKINGLICERCVKRYSKMMKRKGRY